MVWEGVPWMVDQAEHSAEVGRLVAYAAVGRGEGVIAPADCKVTASAIPDGNIHIAPGGVGVLNRAEGGASQAYVLRNVGDEVAAMTPQGASGVRYDLVCVVVEDPQYAGQPDPVSVADGPYLRTKIYEDVASTVRTLAEVDADQTGIALARVKFDASDGTVNAADITDLRQLVNPSTQTERILINNAAATTVPSSYTVLPPGSSTDVRVPEWATHVQLKADWAGIRCTDTGSGAGAASGGAQVALGALVSNATQWQADATGTNKPITISTMAADELNCTAYQGEVLSLQAKLATSAVTGMTVQTTAYTTCVVEATFIQRVI